MNPNTSGRLIRGEWWKTGSSGTATVAIESVRDATATEYDTIVIDTIRITGDGTCAGTLEFTNGTDTTVVVTLSANMDLTLNHISAFARPDATNGAFDLQLDVTGGNVTFYWIGGYHAD